MKKGKYPRAGISQRAAGSARAAEDGAVNGLQRGRRIAAARDARRVVANTGTSPVIREVCVIRRIKQSGC